MLTRAELQRYQRHLALPGFGRAAQEQLQGGRVLVIGAGGLGCPALLYLVAAGVGHITLLDGDLVDTSNLQRQILYTEDDVGEPKALVAASRLRALNQFVTVVGLHERFGRDNAMDLVRACDVVVDGSDNFATRYLVNDACVMADRPFVYGAIQGFDAQLSVFNWRGGPTYRCLFPSAPPPEAAPNCAEAGVLGVVPGIVGTWQACEAIKLVSGIGQPLSGKLLLWNALTMASQTVALAVDPRSRPVVELPPDPPARTCAASDWEIDADDLRAMLARAPVQLLDVREAWERDADAIMPSAHIPLPRLEHMDSDEGLANLHAGEPTIVYCAHGVRSLRATALLRARHGFEDVRSLRGGMHAWRARTAR
jgi:molybdopterin/thiamine biosynthesis adenylyltransferase/rhodanese-related sulfurtransferase